MSRKTKANGGALGKSEAHLPQVEEAVTKAKKAKKAKVKALQASDGQVIAAAPEPAPTPTPTLAEAIADLPEDMRAYAQDLVDTKAIDAAEVDSALESKATKAKPAKPAKPLKEARASPTTDIRLMLAADPAIKPAAIKEALAKKGVHPPISTISTVRADFLGCLRALEAAGRLTSN